MEIINMKKTTASIMVMASFIMIIIANVGMGAATTYNKMQMKIGDNNPPEKPQRPQGEINGGVGNSYTYATRTTDPNSDYIQYGWNWTGEEGAEIDWGPTYYPSGEGVTRNHTWTEEGTYYVRVIARDTSGALSEWSDPLSVTMPVSVQASQQSAPQSQPSSQQTIQGQAAQQQTILQSQPASQPISQNK
jgi:hypothetical protein